MNELVFVKENFNVIHVSFLRKGSIQRKIYKWYLPYCLLDRIHIDTVALIKIDNQRKKVYVVALSYEPKAQKSYHQFPLIGSQPSWQIQLICQYLTKRGIKYYRERAFSGLTGIYNKLLLVDISFQLNGQWYFIEYHGAHHYFKRGVSIQRFRNILRSMEIKRIWCGKHQIPYLEIPFFRQTEIINLVDQFISGNPTK